MSYQAVIIHAPTLFSIPPSGYRRYLRYLTKACSINNTSQPTAAKVLLTFHPPLTRPACNHDNCLRALVRAGNVPITAFCSHAQSELVSMRDPDVAAKCNESQSQMSSAWVCLITLVQTASSARKSSSTVSSTSSMAATSSTTPSITTTLTVTSSNPTLFAPFQTGFYA